MICRKCGCRVSDTATFCEKCGAPVEEFGVQEIKGKVHTTINKKRIIVVIIFLFICCIGVFFAYKNGAFLKQNERYVLQAAKAARAQTKFPSTFELYKAYVKKPSDNSDEKTSVCVIYSSLSELDDQNAKATVEYTFGLVTISRFGKCTYTDEKTVIQWAYERSAGSEKAESIARGAALSFEMGLRDVISNGEEVAVDKVNEMLL